MLDEFGLETLVEYNFKIVNYFDMKTVLINLTTNEMIKASMIWNLISPEVLLRI